MKKIIFTLAFVFVLATSAFGAAEVTSRALPPNLKEYIKLFADSVPPDAGKDRISTNYHRYVLGSNRDAVVPFAQIEGDPNKIDTALEWLYASYYHAAVRDIRPPVAAAILPVNNPKLVDQIIGAETLRDIQIARFLGNTDAVSRYEGGLKFITDRGNATRAEIEKFYRDNIRSLISAVVDEEFNKVSFNLINSDTFHIARGHDAVLIRNPQNGHLTLNYGGTYTNNETRSITANSLEALASEMGRRTSDFDQTGINAVRAQAVLIPAVALSDTALNEIKTILTNFYTTPNATTYNAAKEVYVLYTNLRLETGRAIWELIRLAHIAALTNFNVGLARKVVEDGRTSGTITTLTSAQRQRLVQLR